MPRGKKICTITYKAAKNLTNVDNITNCLWGSGV